MPTLCLLFYTHNLIITLSLYEIEKKYLNDSTTIRHHAQNNNKIKLSVILTENSENY